jgi:pSer/pThr/pTyr-binding forkhead associated (FHA) protein
MSLKSFLNKLVPPRDKRSPTGSAPTTVQEAFRGEVKDKVPFNKLDTRIEKVGTAAEIDIYVNDEKTTTHPLAAETKIGRDPAQADIIISELIVSKLHCTIFSSGNDYYIKDNNSTNGVYVNHERVTVGRKLENGDIIMLGRKGTVKIVFHKR